MVDMSGEARPYARAAFEFAAAQQAIEQWRDMLDFVVQVSSDVQMVNLLTNPVTVAVGAAILQTVCQPKLDRHCLNLLRLMAKNGRLLALPSVGKQFKLLCQAMAQYVEAVVISAHSLTVAQQDNLITALERRLARKVILRCQVDQTLLAGLIIRVEDWVIDGSVQSRLSRLADQLQA